MRRHDHMSWQDEGQIVENDRTSKLPVRRHKEARPGEALMTKLLKLLVTESGNFPEVAHWFDESGVRPAKAAMTHIVVAEASWRRPANRAARQTCGDACRGLTLTRPPTNISF